MKRYATTLWAFTLLLLAIVARADGRSILIKGGTVIDGTGKPARLADVRIVGDTIRAVGNLKPIAGETTIDATGKVVAPGFIDGHSHADGGIDETPDAATQIRQGITTSIVGQDGGSHFPLSEWIAHLKEHPASINFASFVGHGTIRRQVMGEDYKRATKPEEIEKMRSLVAQEMKRGALGLSSGLEYDPGFYSTTEELVACAQVAGQNGGMYISHLRDEGTAFFAALDELIRIAREGHLPAQVSHIKLDTAPVWNRAGDVLKRMEEARRSGLDITADVYPYLYWQSSIMVLIPSRDWDDRKLWEQGLAEVGGPSHVLLTSYSGNTGWTGKTISDIASATGRDAISIIQEIVHTAHDPGKNGSESVVVTAMTDRDLDAFIASPLTMFCTDGALKGSHPRGAGSYPRVLGVYVRERKTLSLERAIQKATGYPAQRFGLRDRGVVRVGMRADLVIFDPTAVHDTATTAQPTAPPVGISDVFVNGVRVLEAGNITKKYPGRFLRRQGRL